MAPVKAKRAFEPRYGFRGPARPDQNVSSCLVTIDIARIDLKRTIDLPKREIIPSLVIVDRPEQSVGAGRCGIECERFLCEPFGFREFVLAELGLSRDDSLEMRAAERGIGGGIARV